MNIIGIIGAMEEELDYLKSRSDVKYTKEIAGLSFVVGHLYDKDIVMVKCGIGKVNAAICTQVLIDYFHVNAVVNVGIAGAVFEQLSIGDIVISSDTVQHDMDTSAFGDPVGIIPRMKESYFKADEKLVALAQKAADFIKANSIKANSIKANSEKNLRVFTGRIASGDQFIAGKDGKKRIWDNVQGYCAEMEGAAIAQACYLNQVPFVLLRAISDNAEGDSTADYEAFSLMAAENAGNLLCIMLSQMD